MSQAKTLRLAPRSPVRAIVTVDAETLAGLDLPAGIGRVEFRVQTTGRVLRGWLHSTSVRKAAAAIGDRPGEFRVVLQGELAGDQLIGAGLAVTPVKNRAVEA